MKLNPSNLNTSTSGVDVDYGLECISGMKKAMLTFKEKPNNNSLKIIYTGFNAISRGIESFTDYDLEMKFRESMEGIYQIQEELNRSIKW